MAPRRAAAISAASSMAAAASSSSQAGPSNAAAAAPKGNGSSKGGRKSAGGTAASGAAVNGAGPAQAQASTALQPPQTDLSPIIARLRTMWKFAAICQFLFTFDEAFGMSGFESDAFEKDLDGTETRIVPDLMRRLLYTLTLNRTVDESNWEQHLRAQYNKRDPENSVLGTEESPTSWHALSLSKKVETIHTLCEWQLWDAERFRKLVKNDEDAHVWRIDPIGWDGQDNTYWLFDDNRLWVQHPPPAPKPQLKAKAPPKKSSKKAKAEARREAKRKREVASRTRMPAAKRTRPARGAANDAAAEGSMTPAGEGDESELSDPPTDDEMDLSIAPEEIEVKEEAMDVGEDSRVDTNGVSHSEQADDDEEKPSNGAKSENGVPDQEKEDDWVEFEAVAVDRAQWEYYAARFAKSRHPDEKALHALLKETVLPKVMADIEEAEKQRALEAAMANRKRSSRIALKESEREEKERDRIARIKMEEKMAAIRDEEEAKERKEREEIDATRLREERLREREERILAREREALERAEREVFEREERERMRELRKLRREQGLPDLMDEDKSSVGTPTHGAEVNSEDNWELDCEVCGRHGINLDDAQELVCCESCGVWQHTECWHAFDRSTSRPRRNWDVEDFYCSKCRPPAPGQPWPKNPRFAQRVPSSLVPRETSSAAATPPPIPPVVPSQGHPHPAQMGSVPLTYNAQAGIAHAAPRPSMAPMAMPSQAMPSGGHATAPVMQQQQRAATPQAAIYPQQTTPRPMPQALPQNAYHPATMGQMGPPRTPMEHGQQATPMPHNAQASTVHAPSHRPFGSPVQPPASASRPEAVSAQPLAPASPLPPSAQSPVGAAVSPSAVRSSPAASGPASPQLTNGTSAAAQPQQGSPRPRPPALSPSPKMSTTALPLRSPQSFGAAATSSVPRHVANQPSGSFPMRHMAVRSPLSGPHTSSPPTGVPNMSIGPPLRAGSPSPAQRASGEDNRSAPSLGKPESSVSELAASRPAGSQTQLGHELLHGRQTPGQGETMVVQPRQSPMPSLQGLAAAAASTQPVMPSGQVGPGPQQGSLARGDMMSQGSSLPAKSAPTASPSAPSMQQAPQPSQQYVPASSAALTAVGNTSTPQPPQ